MKILNPKLLNPKPGNPKPQMLDFLWVASWELFKLYTLRFNPNRGASFSETPIEVDPIALGTNGVTRVL